MVGISCELFLHIQVQEASHFFIFLNQMTPDSEHLLSLLIGFARHTMLAILGAPFPSISAHEDPGAQKSREMGKSCFLAHVVGIIFSAASSLLHDVHLWGTGTWKCLSDHIVRVPWLDSEATECSFWLSCSHGGFTSPQSKRCSCPQTWVCFQGCPFPGLETHLPSLLFMQSRISLGDPAF